MKKTDTSKIDQAWPVAELEHVDACPYCQETTRSVAYKDVQDWSFYCAPGKWTYWNCSNCEALYLNPRPTEISIGKAYEKYYTHSTSSSTFKLRIKTRIKNECFFHWKNANLNPRLHIPGWLSFILEPLKKMLHIPFELEQLVNLPKGKLLDVGCGSGNTLQVAMQLGWDVTGLEIDPSAVKAARAQGLKVIEGDYRNLKDIASEFDCVICSHVLEHVHQPLDLLEVLTKTLKSNGTLLLSLPNAKSEVRDKFGVYWRGIEAPRHLAIPSLHKIKQILSNLDHINIAQFDIYDVTVLDSNRILKNKSSTSMIDYFRLKIWRKNKKHLISDFIQLSSIKK
jgi:2-polyprenyl-3-methyl-5-hydroxy-6-metoxy-1,4-benzoquinol methylase